MRWPDQCTSTRYVLRSITARIWLRDGQAGQAADSASGVRAAQAPVLAGSERARPRRNTGPVPALAHAAPRREEAAAPGGPPARPRTPRRSRFFEELRRCGTAQGGHQRRRADRTPVRVRAIGGQHQADSTAWTLRGHGLLHLRQGRVRQSVSLSPRSCSHRSPKPGTRASSGTQPAQPQAPPHPSQLDFQGRL